MFLQPILYFLCLLRPVSPRSQCHIFLDLPFSLFEVLASKGAYFLEGDLGKTPSGTSSSQTPIALDIGAQTQVPHNSTHSV